MRTLTVLFLLTLSVLASAEPISKERARAFAAEHFAAHGVTVKENQKVFSAPRRNAPSHETAAYYVFNAEGDNGFVIISGDDRIEPCLGYSLTGSFVEKEMPENMKAWLQGYADAIEKLDESYEMSAPSKVAKHRAVESLIKTKWNQYAPYNGRCPAVNGERCVTGCVATAMAQIMYYYKHPVEKCEEIPAYKSKSRGFAMRALLPYSFKWDEMQETYEEGAVDDAVATLMLYCGQSVLMDYTVTESGAASKYVATALPEYFGYASDILLIGRSSYSQSEWDELIYKEISENRPVYCAGVSIADKGHAFICDGYDGDGFYHFNWGWSGTGDGYYRMGMPHDGLFQGELEAVIGIHPEDGTLDNIKPRVSVRDLTYSNTVLNANIYNGTSKTLTFERGWALENEDGSIGRLLVNLGEKENMRYYANSKSSMRYNLDDANLPCGKYKVVAVARNEGDEEWYRASPPEYYFEVNVNEILLTDITVHPVKKFEVTEVAITGDRIATMKQDVSVTLKNLGDESLFTIYLFANNTDTYMGTYASKMEFGIEAGESETINLSFIPYTNGIFNVWLATDVAGNNVIGKFQTEIRKAPYGDSKLELLDDEIVVDNLTAKLKLTVRNISTENYYSPVYVQIYKDDNNWISCDYQNQRKDIEPGHRDVFEFEFTDLEPDEDYVVIATYPERYDDRTRKFLGKITFRTVSTGIETVVDDGQSAAQYFTIDGLRIKCPTKPGVYILRGKKVLVK